MKIIHLKRHNGMSNCNSYLIFGDWDRPGDINTIIDPGKDAFVFDEIERLSSVSLKCFIPLDIHQNHSVCTRRLKKRYLPAILCTQLHEKDSIMAFTFFMRDQPTLEYAADHMIPYASGRSRIKIWDAGCALGQETYTIAMIFAEKMNHYGFKNLRIDATDYDSANNFGDVVTAATYPDDELKRTPSELLAKYFEKVDQSRYSRVVEMLRSRVFFQYHDLLSYKSVGEDYCLIVCKNVMLHFQYAERVEVFKMFHKALAPGGYLANENTQKLPQEVSHLFTQVVPDAQLYKKVGE